MIQIQLRKSPHQLLYYYFFLINLSSLTEFKEIILLISFLSFVTFKDKSVPPLKNIELGFSLIFFINSLIFFGEKYFLFPLFKLMFSEFIFFKRFIIFFYFYQIDQIC